jgi:hypothetical protein
LLSLSLSSPQLAHVQRFADLLVVAPRRKTLAELARQELDGVDASNLADWVRSLSCADYAAFCASFSAFSA